MIAVSINYQLNMFAFGNGIGEKNLALQDKRAAISWVRTNIGGFGGDAVSVSHRA
jgi:carboxylesterase type B